MPVLIQESFVFRSTRPKPESGFICTCGSADGSYPYHLQEQGIGTLPEILSRQVDRSMGFQGLWAADLKSHVRAAGDFWTRMELESRIRTVSHDSFVPFVP